MILSISFHIAVIHQVIRLVVRLEIVNIIMVWTFIFHWDYYNKYFDNFTQFLTKFNWIHYLRLFELRNIKQTTIRYYFFFENHSNNLTQYKPLYEVDTWISWPVQSILTAEDISCIDSLQRLNLLYYKCSTFFVSKSSINNIFYFVFK